MCNQKIHQPSSNVLHSRQLSCTLHCVTLTCDDRYTALGTLSQFYFLCFLVFEVRGAHIGQVDGENMYCSLL